MAEHSTPLLQKALAEVLGKDHAQRGCITEHALPSRKQWHGMLSGYYPGCGSPIYISGTNGGTMPCGGTLIDLEGNKTQEFCYACEENKSSHTGLKAHD